MKISGLAEIASQFDAMLIDQFGVIHDGQKLYPGALEVMQQLARVGVPVVVMTNSGKRAAPNAERIVKMGIPRELFVDCVSSGEVAWQSLKIKTAYLIGKRGEDYGFDPIQFVDDPTRADVMLILGSNAPETSLDDYRRMFEGISLPAICCNPDKIMITSKGLQAAPGAIAEVYEQMGGKVTWIGKPYGGIYEYALKLLNHSSSFPRTRETRLSTGSLAESLDSRVRGNDGLGGLTRVLCIGDSAEHDVAGGRNAGLSTLLVMQGVSANADPAKIHPYPDYIMNSFRWPSSPSAS